MPLPKAFTTEGLITLENILEVIVGEIEDEHCPVRGVPVKNAPGEWCIAGSEPILNVAELLGVGSESNGVYNTLGRFIISEMGTFSKEGEFVMYAGCGVYRLM